MVGVTETSFGWTAAFKCECDHTLFPDEDTLKKGMWIHDIEPIKHTRVRIVLVYHWDCKDQRETYPDQEVVDELLSLLKVDSEGYGVYTDTEDIERVTVSIGKAVVLNTKVSNNNKYRRRRYCGIRVAYYHKL